MCGVLISGLGSKETKKKSKSHVSQVLPEKEPVRCTLEQIGVTLRNKFRLEPYTGSCIKNFWRVPFRDLNIWSGLKARRGKAE
jgi:hypothetical protein